MQTLKQTRQTHSVSPIIQKCLSQQQQLNDQQQQKMINQIKILGSQIFQDQSYIGNNGQLLLDFQQKFLLMNSNNRKSSHNILYNQNRKYSSYTQRNQNQVQNNQLLLMNQDDWISFDDVNHDNYHNKDINKNIDKNINKNINKNNTQDREDKKNDHINKNIKNISNIHNGNSPYIKKKVTTAKPAPKNFKQHITKKTSKNTLLINPEHQPNYLKPTKNIRPQILNHIYQKQRKQYQQVQSSRFTTKNSSIMHSTLQQLYKQKIPLYQKYLHDSHMKQLKVSVSRIQQQQKQMQQFVGRPTINNNIEINDTFEQRVINKNQQKQHNKVKIVSEMMQPYTFRPKLVQNKKYNNIQPRVPTQWKNSKKSNKQIEYDYEFYGKNGDEMMKGLSQELIKTGSFFSEEENNNTNKNKDFQIKLKNPNQLSYILEIDDFEDS